MMHGMKFRRLRFALAAAGTCAALLGAALRPACAWDLWERFAATDMDGDRVVDASDARQITTSEGQSYALFFALVANDRPAFDRLLAWTENNLAGGDITKRLPAWLWGRQRGWGVIDSNNATDSDLWIAWCLLEAGRLWEEPAYTAKARGMMALLLSNETRDVAGLGPVVLPGHAGFEEGRGEARVVKLNPSYAPVFLLKRLALEDPAWKPVAEAAPAMIVRASPSGFAPEWARFTAAGRLVRPEGEDFTDGSYNAIRTYLWAGMTSPADPSRALLLNHFRPMIEATQALNLPPRHVNALTGETGEAGPDYFGACLLPALRGGSPEEVRTAAWLRTVLSAAPVVKDRYYGNVLTLFGLGFDGGRFAFDDEGRLVPGPDWAGRAPERPSAAAPEPSPAAAPTPPPGSSAGETAGRPPQPPESTERAGTPAAPEAPAEGASGRTSDPEETRS